MIIVSDTTPLRYLIEIDEIYVLEKLFGGLLLPRGEGQFAFMHLSLQEYFAACFWNRA